MAASGSSDDGRRDHRVHSSRLLVRGHEPGGSIGTHQAKRPVVQVPCHLVGGAARAPGHRRYVIDTRALPAGRRACPSTLTRTLHPVARLHLDLTSRQGVHAPRLAPHPGGRAVPEPAPPRPDRPPPGATTVSTRKPIRPFFIWVAHTCTSSAPAANSAARAAARDTPDSDHRCRSTARRPRPPRSPAPPGSGEEHWGTRSGFRPPGPPRSRADRAASAPAAGRTRAPEAATAPVGVVASPMTGPLGDRPRCPPAGSLSRAREPESRRAPPAPSRCRRPPVGGRMRSMPRLLEPLDPAHDVHQRVHRADLVERDLLRRHAVDPALGLAQQSERADGALAYPARRAAPAIESRSARRRDDAGRGGGRGSGRMGVCGGA